MNNKSVSFSLITGLFWAGTSLSAELVWQDLSADGRVSGKPADLSEFRIEAHEDTGIPWVTGTGKIAVIALDPTTQALPTTSSLAA